MPVLSQHSFELVIKPILRHYSDDIRFLEHPLPTNVYLTLRLNFLRKNLRRALLGLPSLLNNTLIITLGFHYTYVDLKTH